MVKGIDIFKEFFREFQEQYVLIGGAACDLVLGEADLPFRATKDLDMVLIVEALTPEFGRRFWEFIGEGGYENRAKSNGSPQFYRFDKPKIPGFPYMIELFARAESIFDSGEHGCMPLHMGDEISSLSAILLNSDYYQMLLEGRTVLSEVAILPHTYLILFKAKAWLDLSERRDIDSRDIRKHKNDVVRLTALLTGNERCELSDSVKADMERFIISFETDPIDPKALSIPGLTSRDISDTLKRVYL